MPSIRPINLPSVMPDLDDLPVNRDLLTAYMAANGLLSVTVHAAIFEEANVDEEEMGIVLQEWRRQLPNHCVANAERARAFIQENEIKSS